MREYITVLDYSTGVVHIYCEYIDDSIELEEKISKLGHKPSECS